MIFLQHPKVPLWTTAGPISKIHSTIGLRVSFLFVCEIAVHSVSTCPEECTFVDHRGLLCFSHHVTVANFGKKNLGKAGLS